MPNYVPNSNKYKQEQKENTEREKATKVVTGTTVTKKKSAGSRLRDVFISEDAGSVKSYLWSDVFVPAAKKLLTDIVKDGIDIILYGGTNRNRDSRGNTTIPYVSYNRVGSNSRPEPVTNHAAWDFEDIEYKYRSDAEAVRNEMDAMLERYGYVTVADMYDMADRTAPAMYNKYGWTNLRNVEPIRTRNGYILKLPKPMPID